MIFRGLLLVLIAFGLALFWNRYSFVNENNQGVDQISKDNIYRAYKIFSDLTVNQPDNPTFVYNLGHSLEKNGETQSAIDEYINSSKKSYNDYEKFEAHFNAARIFGEMKEIDRAIEQYQIALDYNPGSKDTQKNIELLMQQAGQGGKGKDKDKNKKNDGKGDKDKQDEDEKQKDEGQDRSNPEYKPQPFKGEKLDKEDVRKILEELKRQEEKIRGKIMKGKTKDKKLEKDW